MAVRAAISLHDDALRYLEIDKVADGFRVVRSVELPMSRDGFSNFTGVVMSLRAQVGKFPPIAFGVPMRESMLRLVEYPKMPLEDAKQAFQFDFDRYFTWSYLESAVDMCEVELPTPVPPGKMSMLVAACRNDIISQILEISEKVNIKIAAIEPMSVALLRVIAGKNNVRNGTWYSFFAEPHGLHFAFVFNNNGIFYRSSFALGVWDMETDDGILAVMEEIQKTITFVGNQFRGVTPQRVVLSGLFANNPRVAEVIESSTTLSVESIDIYSQCGLEDAQSLSNGFEPALGLCLRNEI